MKRCRGWMGVAATVVRALDGWTKTATTTTSLYPKPPLFAMMSSLRTTHHSNDSDWTWNDRCSCSFCSPSFPLPDQPRSIASRDYCHKTVTFSPPSLLKRSVFSQSTYSSSSSSSMASFSTMSNVRSFWLRFRGGGAASNVDDDQVAGQNPSNTTTPSQQSSSSSSPASSRHAHTYPYHPNHNNNNHVHHHCYYDPMLLYSYEAAICSVQGMRDEMEDDLFVSDRGEFAAVFDGHGGPAVSKYLRQNLFARLQAALPMVASTTSSTTITTNTNTLDEMSDATTTTTTAFPTTTASTSSYSADDYVQAMIMAIDKIDQEVLKITHWSFQGSALVAVWLHQEAVPPEYNDENNNNTSATPIVTTILAANVGDCRAVLSRNGTAVPLTRDHKPDDPDEWARIEAAGGKVVWCEDSELYRINGNMALSRSVGDRSERLHGVNAEPEITVTPMMVELDEFIVMASDGLWDVMTSDEVVELIHYLLLQVEPDIIADLVTEEALLRGTMDNVTVVIIFLRSRRRVP